jgi:4-amino-4-deoxy-L-arabinose transferase-like glycosyltransferase
LPAVTHELIVIDAPTSAPVSGQLAPVQVERQFLLRLWRLRSSAVGLAAATTILAFVLRLATAAHFRTADETAWLRRSVGFSDALASGHFGDASATSGALATMPGVTTMWIGSIARGVWLIGHRLGLWAGVDTATFTGTRSGLAVAQAGAAAATALLIGLMVILLCVWVGRGAAAVAGVLLATEPFLVAHGAVLHTDELLALFGVNALIAAAVALGLPHRTSWAGRPRVAALSGVLLGAAMLTKVSAVMFVPSLGLLAVWASVRAVRPLDRVFDWQSALDELRGSAAWWMAGAVTVVVAAYPALWADPVEEFRLLRQSSQMAGTGHLTFFLGHATTTPGPAYYVIALPLRLTPWFLVAGAVAAVAMWCRREWRGFAVAAVFMVVPPFVVLSLAAKQFDRYGLSIVVVAAIVVGIVTAWSVQVLREKIPLGRRPAIAGALIAVVLAAHSLVIAPWGLAYFNPLLGGSSTGERTVLVGWGEGLEKAGAIIEQREAGRCQSVTIRSFYIPTAYPCGKWIFPGSQKPTYIVIYVHDRQRVPPDRLARLVRGYQLVGQVEIRGITYAEVYGPTGARK